MGMALQPKHWSDTVKKTDNNKSTNICDIKVINDNCSDHYSGGVIGLKLVVQSLINI